MCYSILDLINLACVRRSPIMAPANSPWGKKSLQQPKAPNSAFPGLKSPGNNTTVPQSPGTKSQYEEIQEDELIALASIYGEDFKQLETKHGAWKVGYRAEL